MIQINATTRAESEAKCPCGGLVHFGYQVEVANAWTSPVTRHALPACPTFINSDFDAFARLVRR